MSEHLMIWLEMTEAEQLEELVAAVIYDTLHGHGAWLFVPSESTKSICIAQARAAIAALREAGAMT